MATQATNENPTIDLGERHLTLQEFAAREGVAVQTVKAWRVQGYGPRAMKVGKFVRYRIADIITWEDSLLEEGN